MLRPPAASPRTAGMPPCAMADWPSSDSMKSENSLAAIGCGASLTISARREKAGAWSAAKGAPRFGLSSIQASAWEPMMLMAMTFSPETTVSFMLPELA